MGTGLRVEIVNSDDNSPVSDVVFNDFPVRIGRDALAEVSLPYGFVTRWHAILKIEDGAVLLWDLGSTNGTTLDAPVARLSPHEKVDLRQHGMSFRIGPLRFSLEVVEREPAPRPRERGGPMLSSAPGMTPPAQAAPDLAQSAEARALAYELRGVYESYRAGWKRFADQLASSLATRSPATRAHLAGLLAQDFPEAFAGPEAHRLAAALGLEPSELRGTLRDEDVALQVLQELADWYQTPQALVGPEAIVGFGQKIQDSLDALFAAYVPLRNGLRTFEAEFEVKQEGPPSRGASGVAQAETQLEVGARSLDWTDPLDGAHAFRSLFADQMIHNMSLISGVMTGASALIKQLSPEALTEAFEEARRAGRTGVSFGVLRYRELWRALERRHREFVKEESETFKLLFGREFAATYQQFFSSATADVNTAGRSARPPARGAEGAGASRARPRAPSPERYEKTPETHGQPPAAARAQGPTGTVIAPRAALAPAVTGPTASAANGTRRDERS